MLGLLILLYATALEAGPAGQKERDEQQIYQSMEQKTWDGCQALWSRDPVTKHAPSRLERKRARQDCECEELYQHRYYSGGLFFGNTGRPED